jgi:signal peptidase II
MATKKYYGELIILFFFTNMTKIGYLIAVNITLIDQITKWWILDSMMQPPRTIPLTPFFNLVLAWNSGISFGLLNNNNDFNALMLSILAIFILVFLHFWLNKAETKQIAIGLGLIIGGAIGNVIDRLVHGAVVDFLDFHLNNYHWPAFNVADSSITIGAIILILESLFSINQK